MKFWLIALLITLAHCVEEKELTDVKKEDCVDVITSNCLASDDSTEDVNAEVPEHCPVDKQTSDYLVDLDKLHSNCGSHGIDIRELTVGQINEHFSMGTLSSFELTKCYLTRINEMNIHLRSVIEVNPEAAALARKADEERSTRSNKSPIHGIPILLKDNIGTADRMQTTAGALALEHLKPLRDAEVVTRLRRAGAIILGKASLSEWANFRGNIPSGWNGRRGQTVNAYVLRQNPSGSSSGSAVSVSANLATLSLGTETDGSIIAPSTRSAIVGLKPTLGAVSTTGVIALAFSNDVVGPMVRTVQDASILMGVISDIDLKGCNLNISSCLQDRVFKIGVLREPFWNKNDTNVAPIIPVLEKCLNDLNETGKAVVMDPVTFPFKPIDRLKSTIVFRHEFKHSLNKYLTEDVEHKAADRNRTVYSLEDVIKFNDLNPPVEGYDQDTLLYSNATNGLQNKTYESFLHDYQRDAKQYLDSIFNNTGVDALATPCHMNSTPLLYSHGAAAGYPTITVPVSTYKAGLPFGLCLLGRPSSEAVLLKLCYFIELSRPAGRPVPQFL
ncbi:probable amidase At4g34880 [Bradysia coprophila]|uniref:probable amidase At4g34880 n=1 Tax=Bradysia coprophila TaxID=38358 RepID=UPI00187DB454|nr:probable amidase At4g34880 [Bradysia coprophila]